jgi:hypothetical protein
MRPTGAAHQRRPEVWAGLGQAVGHPAQAGARGKNIAAFNSSNPAWKESDFEGMLQTHVDNLIMQITSRTNGDWQSDVRAFDEEMEHITRIADALSLGLEKQFPDRFGQQAVN